MTEEMYSKRLASRLVASAAAAIEMLEGRRAVDASVLMSAAGAAGLLDEVTAGSDEARHCRATVAAAVQALRAWPEMGNLGEVGGLSHGTVDLEDSGDEALELRLERLLELAGLMTLLREGDPARASIEGVLERNRIELNLHAERYLGLVDRARELELDLDLADEHPAAELLGEVALAEALAADRMPAERMRARVDAARHALFGKVVRMSFAHRRATGFRLAADTAQEPLHDPGYQGQVVFDDGSIEVRAIEIERKAPDGALESVVGVRIRVHPEVAADLVAEGAVRVRELDEQGALGAELEPVDVLARPLLWWGTFLRDRIAIELPEQGLSLALRIERS